MLAFVAEVVMVLVRLIATASARMCRGARELPVSNLAVQERAGQRGRQPTCLDLISKALLAIIVVGAALNRPDMRRLLFLAFTLVLGAACLEIWVVLHPEIATTLNSGHLVGMLGAVFLGARELALPVSEVPLARRLSLRHRQSIPRLHVEYDV